MSLQTIKKIRIFKKYGTHMLYREDKSRYYMVGYKIKHITDHIIHYYNAIQFLIQDFVQHI